MPAFQDLLSKSQQLVNIEFENPTKKKSKSKKVVGTGCSTCIIPKRDDIQVKKIKGLTRIKGKKIFIWGRNPGAKENLKGKEFVGPAGEFLWTELKRLGIARSDCDVQNVVRCFYPDWNDDEERWEDKEPPKEVYKCCTKYNERALALNAGNAKVHIVLGQSAARVLLGREYKKDTPIFWSEKLKARVVCLDHPSYFLHGAPNHRLIQFRERLATAIESLKHHGKYSILKKQDYRLLFRYKEVKDYLAYIRAFALKRKRAVVVDIEDGYTYKGMSSEELRRNEICKETPGAKHALLVIGFCHAPGCSRTVVVDHPDTAVSKKERNKVKKLLRRFLIDRAVEKVMHYGSSDYDSIFELLGIRINNYWFDTNYSTYLLWPTLNKYGLDNLVKEKLPEFSGYKSIVKDFIVQGKANFATIPLKIHKLYNGGDTDVTKRLEILTRKPLLTRDKASKPLLQTYCHVAFTLRDMTERGPFFDFIYAKKFKVKLKEKLNQELKALRKYAGDKEFNPRSPLQVKKVMYETLKLPVLTIKRKTGSTDEKTIKHIQTKKPHKFLDHLLEYRGLNNMDRTSMRGYYASAKRYGGRLRTIYWLTGGITGRLRSGGKDQEDIVNLQNINKNPVIKNLLVSDTRWRKIKSWFEKKNFTRIKKRKVLLVADYSAIELRVIGEIAEPKFIKIFKSGKDVHGLMGSGFTDWTYDQICTDEEIRTKVKNINFGLPFGMGKQSFFEGLIERGTKISRKESDRIYDEYFKEYDGITRFQNESRQFAEENGYVPTLFGFHRPVLADDTRNTWAGNQAINSRIQGTAHQYLLFAMALLRKQKKRFNRLQESSMEIHDALAFFTTVEHMAEAYKQLKELLEVAVPAYVEKYFNYKLKIPLICEIKGGFRLGTMVKYFGGDTMEFVKEWLKKNDETDALLNKQWGLAA